MVQVLVLAVRKPVLTCVCVSGDSDGPQQEGDGGPVHRRPTPGGDRKCGPDRQTVGPAQSRL